MGAGPISVPSASPGAQAAAMAKVREAIKILIGALPELPIGSDPFKTVQSSIQGLSKHVSPGEEVPGMQQTALRDLQQGAGKNAALEAVMRSLGSPGGGAGSVPGGATPGGGSAAGPSPMM
jgi:hypothetical protein